ILLQSASVEIEPPGPRDEAHPNHRLLPPARPRGTALRSHLLRAPTHLLLLLPSRPTRGPLRLFSVRFGRRSFRAGTAACGLGSRSLGGGGGARPATLPATLLGSARRGGGPSARRGRSSRPPGRTGASAT